MNNFTVYIHRNKINNKAYIGQTCQGLSQRWGRGSMYKTCSLFYKAIQKYGWDNFEHIVFATGLSQEEANKTEKMLIALFDTMNKEKGYNLTSGGDNRKLSQETKDKIGKSGRKAVYCIELDRVFDSITIAANELGLNTGHISNCCKGKRKTCGGYHWEYFCNKG